MRPSWTAVTSLGGEVPKGVCLLQHTLSPTHHSGKVRHYIQVSLASNGDGCTRASYYPFSLAAVQVWLRVSTARKLRLLSTRPWVISSSTEVTLEMRVTEAVHVMFGVGRP